jgi:hypothetical protein
LKKFKKNEKNIRKNLVCNIEGARGKCEKLKKSKISSPNDLAQQDHGQRRISFIL